MKKFKQIYSKKYKSRADKYLADNISDLSRSEIQEFISRGRLKINGKVIDNASEELKEGDKTVFEYEFTGIKKSPKELNVLYEDKDFLIVEKPAEIVVFPTAKFSNDSVAARLIGSYPEQERLGKQKRFGIAHRLDRQTSGLVAVARNKKAYEYLKELFKNRRIKKEYLALVYGNANKKGVIEKPLSKIGQSGRSKVQVSEKGKPAKTEFEVVDYYSHHFAPDEGGTEGGSKGGGENTETPPSLNPSPQGGGKEGSEPSPAPSFAEASEDSRRGEEVGAGVDPAPEPWNGVDTFSFVKVELHTGRTHQIRVHFASIGHPVMGDTLYGKPDSQKLDKILPRIFLHANLLEFKDLKGNWLSAESELPEDLEAVLSNLKKLSN